MIPKEGTNELGAQQFAVVSAWIAAPPWLRQTSGALERAVEELLTLVDRYGVRSVLTTEPCYYNTTTTGKIALRNAFRESAVDLAYILFDHRNDAQGNVAASISLANSGPPIPEIARYTIGMQMMLPAVQPEYLRRIVEFVQRQCANLDAAYAFIAPESEEFPTTKFEQAHNGYPDMRWARTLVRPRGVFWGNYLGPRMCEALGGRVRVLADAPVFFAEPVGEGVWLQLSEHPGETVSTDQLTSYLQRLLESDDTVAQAYDPPVDSAQNPEISMMRWFQADPESETPVPVRVTASYDPSEEQRVVNIHCEGKLSREQRYDMDVLLSKWYYKGNDTGFSGSILGWRSYPTVNMNTIRFLVDVEDFTEPLAVLCRRLAAISFARVTEVVLGVEYIG